MLRELAGLPRERVDDEALGLARLLRELAGLSLAYVHAWPLERSVLGAARALACSHRELAGWPLERAVRIDLVV